MKIVDIAIKRAYRFNCPVCGSRLEGESEDFEDVGGKINKFFCPVCKKKTVIFRGRNLGRKLFMMVSKIYN